MCCEGAALQFLSELLSYLSGVALRQMVWRTGRSESDPHYIITAAAHGVMCLQR